ncbi:MAG: AAA family ATPase [Deltaproteobacteria bacterium]|uniref:AAA family ATPase n=1 Tax=Candidatus Zymogenus saltonus TaxID=2844893 RepID=A0A9D8KGB9_9DELT|nr:AAA family ATPase [Candidatus Zymogenus saltonus]
MKIIELKAENIKNLKAVEIRPDGNAVVLTGKNGAGKSAVLDSIFMALTGKKVEEPIRRGEKRAEVSVDLGKYVVRKVWTEKGDRLEVRSKDGALYQGPQSLLNAVIGALSFDPLEFIEMKEESQRDLILELAGVNLEKFRTKRQEVFDERTDANREVRRLKGVLSSLTEPSGDVPLDEIDVAAQVKKVNGLKDQNRIYNEQRQDIEEHKARLEEIAKEISVLEEEAHELRGLLSFEGDMVDPVSNEEIKAEEERLHKISEINQTIRDARQWRETRTAHEAAISVSDVLTEKLEAIDLAKDEKIRSVKFPIDGLGVTDEAVTYRGIPIEQLSTGEKIRVSTAIAMAMNPELRVIFVKEGSLLDGDGMSEIVRLTKDGDYQVWIERVDSSGEVGIFIEDGVITAENGVRKPEGANNDSESIAENEDHQLPGI